MSNVLTGRCMCGAVSFTVPRDGAGVADLCHCSQCRRWSGHAWGAIDVLYSALDITSGGDRLKWFRASSDAQRGFCAECGSPLFWHGDKLDAYKDRIGVSLGALDSPTGLSLEKHIFVADKGDYYEIADGLPQKEKD